MPYGTHSTGGRRLVGAACHTEREVLPAHDAAEGHPGGGREASRGPHSDCSEGAAPLQTPPQCRRKVLEAPQLGRAVAHLGASLPKFERAL